MSYENKFEDLKKQLEKLQEIGDESIEDWNKELENLISSNFGEDLEKEIFNSVRTKTIKVKKLHTDAVLPKYNYPSDSGFDLHSVDEIEIPALGRALVPTGLSFQFDEGFEIQMRPKSGLAINQGITILNTPGTIDQGYNGEIKAIVFNSNNHPFTVKKGMKIAQAVLCPVMNGKFVEIAEVDELNETDRENNGFGSTGI